MQNISRESNMQRLVKERKRNNERKSYFKKVIKESYKLSFFATSEINIENANCFTCI